MIFRMRDRMTLCRDAENIGYRMLFALFLID
jgi:hypothetical protein